MRVRLDIPPRLPGLVLRHAYQVQREWTGPSHRHPELELNLVTGGSATVLVKGRRLELGPRMLAWLFPGQDHLLARQSDDFAMWVAVFSARLVRNCTRQAAYALLGQSNPPGSFARMLQANAFQALTRLLERLAKPDLDDPSRGHGFAWLLTEAWRCFEEAAEVPEGADLHPAVQRMAFLLRDHPETESLADAALGIGLSYARLSRLFHQQMGLTLVQFRNRQRVRRFLELHADSSRSNLTECALQAGFASYPQFFRTFREQMGQSPRAYLQSQTVR
ncbi:MAG: helix-turn-helix domain-containing protein [Opitutales bacterium]